jgi:Zn-dependent membrane protease YugP/Flp pilus assembly protein TadD
MPDELHWTVAVLVPVVGMVLSYALMVSVARHGGTVYRRNAQALARCGLTGRAVAEKLLADCGLGNVPVDDGARMDQYDIRNCRIRLREATSVSSSLAAVTTAAHEVGHAQQFARGHWANRLEPLWYWGQFGPVFVLALGLTLVPFLSPGLLLLAFCASMVAIRLSIVLALEVDTTRRAIQLVKQARIVTDDELPSVTGQLRASLRFYLASAAIHAIMLIGAVVVLSTDPRRYSTEWLLPIDLYWPLVFVGLLCWLRFLKSHFFQTDLAVEWNSTGVALLQRGQFEQALALFDRALARDRHMPLAHFNRAATLVKLGRFKEAADSLAAFIALSPSAVTQKSTQPEVWHLRGQVRLATNDHEGAIEDFSQAVVHLPTLAAAWRDRSAAWIRKREYQRALADANEAVRLDQNDPIARNNRGVAHSKLGDYAAAADDLREAIRLAPQFPNPYRHLAWIAATCPDEGLRNGRIAVEHALRALELSEWKHRDWFQVLAAAHAEAGNWDAAVDWQESYLRTIRGSNDRAAEGELQLQLYFKRRAYREQPPFPSLDLDFHW